MKNWQCSICKKRLGGGFGERSEPKKFFGSTPPDPPRYCTRKPPFPHITKWEEIVSGILRVNIIIITTAVLYAVVHAYAYSTAKVGYKKGWGGSFDPPRGKKMN